jgi:HTH-type transcriptional regulator / antitoxin HigA
METERRFYSDLPIPPGEYLAEVLKTKGMAQAELARRIGRPVQAVNEIVKGEKAITPETAIQFERALDVPADIWTGLESRYQLIKARLAEKEQLRKESGYLARAPYKQLADLKRVGKTGDHEHKVRELQRFYGVSSLANLSGVKGYEVSFRGGGKGSGEGSEAATGFALTAWIRCAELRAAEARTQAFDKNKLRKSLDEILELSRKEAGEVEPGLERVLARCGVALVVLPRFPKTDAKAAAFWIKPDKAVLLLDGSDEWSDRQWLRVFRGVGHLLLHGKRTFIEGGEGEPEHSAKEKEASAFAATWLKKGVR